MGREETDEVLIGDRPADRTIARVARATLRLGPPLLPSPRALAGVFDLPSIALPSQARWWASV